MRQILLSLVILTSFTAFAHDPDCEARLLAAQNGAASFEKSLTDVSDIRGQVVRLLSGLKEEQKLALNLALTARHADREMSFQVKNEMTGYYDKFVAVKADAFVAPLLKSDYDRLVASTGPLMRLYRQLLQHIYSRRNLTVESLGLGHLPDNEAKLALQIVQSSIYYEPALVHPNMAHYPFLSVAGFDGAIVDPKSPQPVFFETNLGTPSGISNNVQLRDDLLAIFPKLNALVKDRLPADDTYTLLRRAVESNARAWTGREGISVVISPGVYNGAHPDVATIARATGMPLVKSSDLYQDKDGWIRLNTGKRARDPVVTGIYGRMEESFFLQNSKEGIPMISPKLNDGGELALKLGVPLRPGAIYDFIYSSTGDIIDVHKDADGAPKLLDVWDTISADPARPQAERGSFAQAVIQRKLYYSAIGGRVVDDKRLFRILTSFVLPRAEGLARPPASLALDDIEKFFEDPKQFVVKPPDMSGGEGISFPVIMPELEIAALVARVKAHPEAFEIQYISPIATLPFTQQTPGGRTFTSDVAIDMRIFVMMNADGHVGAGPNSILLRTAAAGGLKSNTSSKGGYGIGLVLNDQPSASRGNDRSWADTTLTARPANRALQMQALFEGAREVLQCLYLLKDESDWSECRHKALELSFAYRDVMESLNPWHLQVIATLRGFAHSIYPDKNLAVELIRQLGHSIQDMRLTPHSPYAGMATQIVAQNQSLFRRLDPIEIQKMKLPTAARLRRLAAPETTYRFETNFGTRARKVEFAEYQWVDNPEIQELIEEVQEFGGQVRLLLREEVIENPEKPIKRFTREPAYFWLNLDPKSPSYLMPVIGIDLTREMALSALSHEMAHFRLVREIYQGYRERGVSHKEALLKAYTDSDSEEWAVEGERRAVQAELYADVRFSGHPYNRFFGPKWRPNFVYEVGFVNRILYPEFEGVRRHLYRVKEDGHPLSPEFVRKHTASAVKFALESRKSAIEHWRKIDPDSPDLKIIQDQNVYVMLTEPFGRERLESDDLTQEFRSWLAQVCAELNISEEDCGVAPAAR